MLPSTDPDWDPTHIPGRADRHWSTDNVGEALPGALTPMGWTVWSDAAEQMCRDVSYALGVFDRRERRQPPQLDQRIIQPFYGRVALSMEWLAMIGDRMPKTTGKESIESLLGRVPETMRFHPTRSRYPVIAYKLPTAGIRGPRRIRALALPTHGWWKAETVSIAKSDLPSTLMRLAAAHVRFQEVMTEHSIAVFAVMTPLLQGVTGLVARTGVGTVGALSGTGGAELAMIEDLWRASRGELTLEQLVAEHGYHGPWEGEVSGRVWREQPAPLVRMIEGYAARPDSDSPFQRDARARQRLPELQRELVARLPRAQRRAALIFLRYAARSLPLRGVGKASFLQALDVCRACTRHAGTLLAQSGRLADSEDIFYLTLPELLAGVPGNAAELVGARRTRRAEHARLQLPGNWQGTPVPEIIEPTDNRPDVVEGIGVSAGTVEGRVRVVTDPSFDDVEDGEVLVAPTTDPSWASIMFLSSALVVDMGGPLSHAAVVARELGIPCVVNTRNGTRALKTGDRVSVDGATGTVVVLERPTPSPTLEGISK